MLSNGYGPAMCIFTKVSKVPFSHLQSKGFISVVFVNDSCLKGNTYKTCLHNIENTIEQLLQNLGFTIHPIKSILTPTQKITFLGFVIDSVQITLEITEEKNNKIHNLCLETLQKEIIILWTLAIVIGNFVASFPAVPSLGPFFYRNLEKQKILGHKVKQWQIQIQILP